MSRYLVYTCVTNNYDKVRKILTPQHPNIDFICFTDSINKTIDMRKDTGWIFMPMPVELRRLEDKRRQARLLKIGIYKYLKGYSGYLWIDAPIIVIGSIEKFIIKYPLDVNHSIYVSKHYMRDCVYQEFEQVLRLNKDRSAYLYNQYQRYKNMGYPPHNGMAETSILYRNFNDLRVQNHAVMWADEIINYSYRDQLSFNWAAWANKLPITYLSEDIYKRDVVNEKSEFFFLPWPKHNNPNVVAQLKAKLQKDIDDKKALEKEVKVEEQTKTEELPQSAISQTIPQPTLVVQQPQKSQEIIDSFEEEYQKFIEELKKKKEEQKALEVKEEKPKKKRGRKKKVQSN